MIERIIMAPVARTVDNLSSAFAPRPQHAGELVDTIHGGGVLYGVELAFHLGGPVKQGGGLLLVVVTIRRANRVMRSRTCSEMA